MPLRLTRARFRRAAASVDAVHRSVLLRFPDAAEAIAALLQQGKSLLKVELALQYDGYEIVPPEYTCREGLGRKLWTDNPPTWHVQAWPLRHPWIADKANGLVLLHLERYVVDGMQRMAIRRVAGAEMLDGQERH